MYSLVISFVFKSVFNQILNSFIVLVGTLTIIHHMLLIDLWYPQNVQELFKGLFSLITFDMVPTELIYPKLFGLEDQPF